MSDKNLLEVQNLKKYFPIKKGFFNRTVGHLAAVDDVSFVLKSGETLGLVGESGCGKSTLGKTLLMLTEPTEGKILFEGQDIASFSEKKMQEQRKHMQIVFQDPYSSLNPRMTVKQILSEPYKIHGIGSRAEVEEKLKGLTEAVGLTQNCLGKYSHEFSGGQRQRIGIARALALEPKLIVADEPVSALDVSIQSQILNLMTDLRSRFHLAYIFIAHDLAVIEHISDVIAVMYLGKFVEYTSRAELYDNPLHPYTNILIDAIPQPVYQVKKRNRQIIKGDVPNPINPPSGCYFHPRCPRATELCKKQEPELKQCGSQSKPHLVACHHV